MKIVRLYGIDGAPYVEVRLGIGPWGATVKCRDSIGTVTVFNARSSAVKEFIRQLSQPQEEPEDYFNRLGDEW